MKKPTPPWNKPIFPLLGHIAFNYHLHPYHKPYKSECIIRSKIFSNLWFYLLFFSFVVIATSRSLSPLAAFSVSKIAWRLLQIYSGILQMICCASSFLISQLKRQLDLPFSPGDGDISTIEFQSSFSSQIFLLVRPSPIQQPLHKWRILSPTFFSYIPPIWKPSIFITQTTGILLLRIYVNGCTV